jgi:hypothetical protein
MLAPFLLFACIASAAAGGQEPDAHARAAAALAAHAAGELTSVQLAVALQGLGSTALPEVLDALVAYAGEEHAEIRAILLGTLAEVPGDAFTAAVEPMLAGEPDERRLEALIQAIGGSRGAAELGLLERCAAHGELEAGARGLPRARREAFRSALLDMVARDSELRWSLAERLAKTPMGLLSGAIHALASNPDGQTLELLSGALGQVAAADSLLLREIVRVAEQRPSIESSASARLRDYLRSPSNSVAILALQATAALGDRAAIGDLIGLLGHAHPAVRDAAQEALVRLTRKRYRGRADVWERWYDAELAWWVRESPGAFAALESRDPARALLGMRALAEHTLHPAECAEGIARLLTRSEPDLVLAACSALASLQSRQAIEALLALLEHPDPRLVQAAEGALERITGGRLPAVPVLGRAALQESVSR